MSATKFPVREDNHHLVQPHPAHLSFPTSDKDYYRHMLHRVHINQQDFHTWNPDGKHEGHHLLHPVQSSLIHSSLKYHRLLKLFFQHRHPLYLLNIVMQGLMLPLNRMLLCCMYLQMLHCFLHLLFH